jgi:hypothetical protein
MCTPFPHFALILWTEVSRMSRVPALQAFSLVAVIFVAGFTPAPSPPAAPIVVPPADFPRPTKPPLGVNIESPLDYSRTMLFVDTIKSARPFGSPEKPWDNSAPHDEHGWPTSDAGAVIMAGLPVPPGDYSFSCTGKCEVHLVITQGSVHKLAYDSTSDTTTATVTVNPGNDSFFINFTKTSGGVKNIRLLRPGYPVGTSEVFTKEFLAALAPFSTMRLMDFTKTNETDVSEWADRPKPDDAVQTSKRGVAWEYGIMLANQAKKDLWINIPDRASDDYVRQLAKLLLETLDKDRNIYVEYSNEVWNFSFTQARRNLDAAKAEVAAGDKTLTEDGADKNEYYWGWKRVSKRLLQVSDIFKEVFGPTSINTRIRPVLASQSAQVFLARMQVDYIANHFGPPSQYIYGIAGAPYLGPSADIDVDKAGATVDDVIKAFQSQTWPETVTFKFLVLARYYRLHQMCYEGAVAVEGEKNLDVKVQANRDPRIAQIVTNYLTQWYAQGGELFMYYNLSSSWSKYGTWGLTDDMRTPSQKLRAVSALVNGAMPAINRGAAVPGTLEAADVDDNTTVGYNGTGAPEPTADGGRALASLRDNNCFDYLLNVKEPGIYALTLQASGLGHAQVEPILSGTSLGTIDMPTTGDWQKFAPSAPVRVKLSRGQLVLRLHIVRAGCNLRTITFKKES